VEVGLDIRENIMRKAHGSACGFPLHLKHLFGASKEEPVSWTFDTLRSHFSLYLNWSPPEFVQHFDNKS